MSDAVDTNVLVVANGRDTHASPECQLAAVEALEEVRRLGSLVLDLGGEVIAEYSAYCNHAGAPGIGDWFFQWVFQKQSVLTRFELTPHDERGFEEFPDAEQLSGFDPSDRKFVALASIADGGQVINALDSDYSEFAEPLAAAGVTVTELCPNELKASG